MKRILKNTNLLNTTILSVIFCAILTTIGCSDISAKPAKPETQAQKDKRMAWWRDARFGLFIHWGVYAVPAGTYNGKEIPGLGEWIMEGAQIPVEEYEKFAPQFNPVQFDAAEWVKIAKDAGMKYMVITSKHHDGFSMFDSKVSDYDIVDSTPYGRDVMKALSRECKKAGIKFCCYYSILDWHERTPMIKVDSKEIEGDDAKKVYMDERKVEYIGYMKSQLKELIRKYDPAVLWFDGEWSEWWTVEDGKELENYLRGMKPGLIINNRVGKRRVEDGDFGTHEQQIPGTTLVYDWESCMTMNYTWGFKSNDHQWQSTETLVRNLVDIASKGGNYLLNVGPTAEGEIPQPSIERLKEIGKWMAVNGDSIYGTSASPFEKLTWGRCTAKDKKLYLHVFNWPSDGKLEISQLPAKARKAWLLADKNQAKLKIEQPANDKLVINLPQVAVDPIDTVIVLEIDKNIAKK